jgi:hypothetical protein
MFLIKKIYNLYINFKTFYIIIKFLIYTYRVSIYIKPIYFSLMQNNFQVSRIVDYIKQFAHQ